MLLLYTLMQKSPLNKSNERCCHIRDLFCIGELHLTDGIFEIAVKDNGFSKFVQQCMNRHFNGDWGNMDECEKWNNNIAIMPEQPRSRIFSRFYYPADNSLHIWIITEPDRSSTTVMLPQEY